MEAKQGEAAYTAYLIPAGGRRPIPVEDGAHDCLVEGDRIVRMPPGLVRPIRDTLLSKAMRTRIRKEDFSTHGVEVFEARSESRRVVSMMIVCGVQRMLVSLSWLGIAVTVALFTSAAWTGADRTKDGLMSNGDLDRTFLNYSFRQPREMRGAEELDAMKSELEAFRKFKGEQGR